jgi:hypothetical protein
MTKTMLRKHSKRTHLSKQKKDNNPQRKPGPEALSSAKWKNDLEDWIIKVHHAGFLVSIILDLVIDDAMNLVPYSNLRSTDNL